MIHYVGRVLNRFSKDIGYMDDQLQVMFSFYLVVIKLCSIITILCINSDQFFAVVLLLNWYLCISCCSQLLEHHPCLLPVCDILYHTMALCDS